MKKLNLKLVGIQEKMDLYQKIHMLPQDNLKFMSL